MHQLIFVLNGWMHQLRGEFSKMSNIAVLNHHCLLCSLLYILPWGTAWGIRGLPSGFRLHWGRLTSSLSSHIESEGLSTRIASGVGRSALRCTKLRGGMFNSLKVCRVQTWWVVFYHCRGIVRTLPWKSRALFCRVWLILLGSFL